MKTSPWARRFALAVIASAGILIGSSILPSNPLLAARNPKTVVQSYSFLPGQSMNFPNKKYHRVEIHSTFPIRVLTGPCHEEYVVQFTCNSDPGDVFITDRRSKPLFGTPQANQITITEIKK